MFDKHIRPRHKPKIPRRRIIKKGHAHWPPVECLDFGQIAKDSEAVKKMIRQGIGLRQTKARDGNWWEARDEQFLRQPFPIVPSDFEIGVVDNMIRLRMKPGVELDTDGVMILVAIDPSIRRCGAAAFMRNRGRGGIWRVLGAWLWKPVGKRKGRKEKIEWFDRIDQLCRELRLLVKGYRKEYVDPYLSLVVEQPSIMASSVGRVANNSGDILRLAACAASLRQQGIALTMNTKMVAVQTWKGNTPKSITQARVKKYWHVEGLDHNVIDAIGIGDWYIRKYLREPHKPKSRLGLVKMRRRCGV